MAPNTAAFLVHSVCILVLIVTIDAFDGEYCDYFSLIQSPHLGASISGDFNAVRFPLIQVLVISLVLI